MSEIKVGDKVRSFDFADGEWGRDLTGERACYVEGQVISIGMIMEGCPRYEILVERDVFGGEESDRRVGTQVYPPVNGTPSTMGGPTDFVEKLHDAIPIATIQEVIELTRVAKRKAQLAGDKMLMATGGETGRCFDPKEREAFDKLIGIIRTADEALSRLHKL